MSNEIQNPVKRKLIKEEKDESSKQLDKSMHLLRICDEFAVSDDSGEAVEDKNNRFESLRQEIRQWRKLLAESKVPKNASADNDSSQNIAKDYEKYLTADQLQYVRSAVDYKKWLHESTEFRKNVAYYLSMRKYNKKLRADFEQDIRAQLEAVAADEYMEHFALNKYPL